MRLLDEIAHRHGERGDRVTDFYAVEGPNRFKVTETAQPTLIVGGTVTELRYDYVVSLFRPTGWVEVARLGQEHVDTALHAASVANRIITEEGS